MIPVTYYPVPTQRVRARNEQRVRAMPYGHFFDDRMVLREEVLSVLTGPMDPARALGQTPAELNSLLEPGYHEVENGWCELPGGGAYIASLTHFPGATAEMFRWWFWWHSFESERYALWYPYNHVSVRRDDPDTATRPGLTDEQRYLGSTHRITEYIGPDRQDITITFRHPRELGFDAERLAAADVVAHACGEVRLQVPPVRAGTMVHLARATADGLELRSRYWLGDRTDLRLPGGAHLRLTRAGELTGITRRMIGARVAYEQFLHDQIEFTHLAGFLPRIYAEFGPAGTGRAAVMPDSG